MITDLPKEYLERMQKLPGLDFGEFLGSYASAAVKGLRFSRKARNETIEYLIRKWDLKKISWTESGYYYPSDLRPGLSPYHDAGVYYIQEPSAMAVAEAAGIRLTDSVLDLCAAPGGKSTRAAELAKFVLCNEIIPSRAKVLSSNIERMGIGNAIVCSASADRISDAMGPVFDIVIVDAPCSGEGMMRKDETAIREWSVQNVLHCIDRQEELLEHADHCVKEGGKLVYSTCTFEPGENKLQIDRFLNKHPEYELMVQNTLYPHLCDGEGQYYAVLRKGAESTLSNGFSAMQILRQTEKALQHSGIHILRSGFMPGETKTDRKKGKIYIPSHAEVMSTSFYENPFENSADISDEGTAISYLRGNPLMTDCKCVHLKNEKDGFLGVYFNGYPLGVAKKTENVLKNHLPKGLRRL